MPAQITSLSTDRITGNGSISIKTDSGNMAVSVKFDPKGGENQNEREVKDTAIALLREAIAELEKR